MVADGREQVPKSNTVDADERGTAFLGKETVDVSTLKVAIVHDWLPVYAGAEKVLEQMLEVFPHADLFSLIEFLPENQRDFLKGKPVTTSFIQNLPFAKKQYRMYLPFAPLAVEQFDLRGYDLILSSSYVVGKGILTNADQLHISYVHSPIRYAWDLYFDYLENGGISRGIRSWVARLILHYMRLYDVTTASRVDDYLANSNHVARRIRKTYRRAATVLYPPVDTRRFSQSDTRDDYYLTVSRLVPYKRIDLIVNAFTQLPEKKLIVIGDGPEMSKIQASAGPNVQILGYQDDEAVLLHMQRARAFVFAAEEDFGIVPVEAQACGTPVIAFGAGGATETVIDGVSGIHFAHQTEESLVDAIERFESLRFDSARIRAHAESFSEDVFKQALRLHVTNSYLAFKEELR